MSLITFHRALITVGIVFCFGYAGWEGYGWVRTGSEGSLVVAILFVGLGAGLGYYLQRMNRFLGYESDEEGNRSI